MQRSSDGKGRGEGRKGKNGVCGARVHAEGRQGIGNAREGGRQGKCPRAALYVMTNAAAFPCESHRVHVLCAKAPRCRNRYSVLAHPCDTREGLREGKEGWEGGATPLCSAAAMGKEGGREAKEGGGVWDKVCWAVRISPQHRQRRPQRQSAAASKRQRSVQQDSSKQQRTSNGKQWWHQRGRRRGGGGSAGGSSSNSISIVHIGSSSNVHNGGGSSSTSFIVAISSLIPRHPSIRPRSQSVSDSVSQSQPQLQTSQCRREGGKARKTCCCETRGKGGRVRVRV